MTFKSHAQPHCRLCGKPIRKKTTMILFGRQSDLHRGFASRAEKPKSKQEAQKYCNQQITSVSWSRPPAPWSMPDDEAKLFEAEAAYISSASVWDGESYVDEFFDTGGCAQRMGYLAAAKGLTAAPYRDAMARKTAKPMIATG